MTRGVEIVRERAWNESEPVSRHHLGMPAADKSAQLGMPSPRKCSDSRHSSWWAVDGMSRIQSAPIPRRESKYRTERHRERNPDHTITRVRVSVGTNLRLICGEVLACRRGESAAGRIWHDPFRSWAEAVRLLTGRDVESSLFWIRQDRNAGDPSCEIFRGSIGTDTQAGGEALRS
ncbi:hypothetical protein N658DRAFT_140962 [Parathielavia hyrcaniae]|uniref:Uncharacterized protein n=1 Tax=Parathielavia hyrcaniae TaxID=113614 RepID=A0AAN6PY86_9PEZI|nr:hypothetical protein N658DRAFT_140962 [Parathielavia hyrcaniae]